MKDTKKRIDDTIQVVDGSGKQLLPAVDPLFLGTKPIKLSRSKPIQAINMFLPPGVSKFFVERIDKNHIRFLIMTEEVERLAEKAEKTMEAIKKADDTKTKVKATA